MKRQFHDDFSWVDDIARNRKVLFVAEGLLNYFSEEEVRSIISAIKDNFPNSELVFEVHSLLITTGWHRNPHIRKAYSLIKWGINSGKSLERWGDGIKFLEEWHYVDRHPKRWRWMRFFRYVRSLRRAMKIVHLEFSAQLS